MKGTLFVLLIVASCSAAAQEAPEVIEEYFGQTAPGKVAVIFAPGIVSMADRLESKLAFSLDGNECCFQVYARDYSSSIYSARRIGGSWSVPTQADFSIGKNVGNPSYSIDGKTLYFNTNDGKDGDIYMVERSENGWGEPRRLPEPINSPFMEISCGEAPDGNLYFDSSRAGRGGFDLWRASGLSAGNPLAENLGPSINSADFDFGPCVAPDGSFIIFGSERKGRDGRARLYIAFRSAGSWTEVLDLNAGGAQVNSDSAHQSGPSLSPDGRFLFFVRHYDEEAMDVYWVSAEVIDDLRRYIGLP